MSIVAAIVQWQNAALWQRMSWVRNPLAAPTSPPAVEPLTEPALAVERFCSPRSSSRARKRIHRAGPADGPCPVPSLFVGTSGWAYPTWKPGFYPAGLTQKNFLAFYSSRLTTVEVNYTFRTLPTPKMLETGSPRPPALPLRLQGPAAHHALQPAARRQHARRSVPGSACAGRRRRPARPAALPAAAQLQGRPCAARDFLSLPALSGPPRLASRSSSATPPGLRSPSSIASRSTTPRSASPMPARTGRSRHPRGAHRRPPTPASACVAPAATLRPSLPPSPSATASSPAPRGLRRPAPRRRAHRRAERRRPAHLCRSPPA